jgi:tetratricopeptide (TPR) repeat protein
MIAEAQVKSGADLLRDANINALAAHRDGRSDEALAIFDLLIPAAPKLAVLHNNRAVILAELGRDADARPSFERAIALDPHHVDAQVGLGALLWRAGEIAPALTHYRNAASRDPQRLDAHLAIFELAQIAGDRGTALMHQEAALAIRRLYTVEATNPPAERRLLVLKAPGDWQANLPLEYIIDGAANTVHTWYVDERELEHPSSAVPEHDLIINAVSESDAAEPVLAAIGRFAARSAAPMLNDPAHVLRAARHRFPGLLSGIARCTAPVPLRLTRGELKSTRLTQRLDEAGIHPPYVLRPIASQAGRDLARIATGAELSAYLAGVSEDEFYLTPFHEYAGPDGLYRKYRIIFVDGEPFPYHLAISPSWIVHYYNAGMRENAWRREEEARFLADLGAAFDPGLQDALRRLAQAIGLDYFGIDCTVTADNQLLLFEVETGMIVHNLDPVDIYPYKPAAFARIAEALERLLQRRSHLIER